jgi:Zn-dependent protease with chaperone function
LTSLSFVAPILAALLLALVVTTIHRRLPPAVAARVVAVTTVVVAGAALPTLWMLAVGFVAHTPFLGDGFVWCTEVFGVHHQLPWWVGAPTVAFVVVGAVRAARVVRSHRRLRQDHPGSIEIAGHEQPFAVTLPGRGGHIVLSSGLVELLDEAEQRVVIAHEHAHARHRHDRYLLLAQTCAAAIPMLRPLTSRLQFTIERWADEAAVASCGDRRFVAMTLGKVALHAVTPAGVLGFAGLGVPARMAALLGPAPGPARPRVLLGVWLAIAVTAAMGAVQLHHLAGALAELCHA